MLERLVAEVSEVLNKLLMASFTYNDLNQRRACCFACFLSLKHTSIFHTSGVVHTFTLLSVLVTCNASNRTGQDAAAAQDQTKHWLHRRVNNKCSRDSYLLHAANDNKAIL